MSFIRTNPGESVLLAYDAKDGDTGLFPQAKIYDIDGTLITTVNLTHTADGLYQGSYAPSGSVKQLIVRYIAYTNSGRTTESELHTRGTDNIYVEYDSRFSMGSATATAMVDDKTIKRIAEEVWKINLKNFANLHQNSAAAEVVKKSEFDPDEDKVRVEDKQIKQTTEEVQKVVQTGFRAVREAMLEAPKIPDIQPMFETMLSKISGIKMPSIDLSGIQNALGDIQIRLDGMMGHTNHPEMMKEFESISQQISAMMPFVRNDRTDEVKEMIGGSMAHIEAIKMSGEQMNKKLSMLEAVIGRLGELASKLELNDEMLEKLNEEDARRQKEILAAIQIVIAFLSKDKSVLEGMRIVQSRFSDLSYEP